MVSEAEDRNGQKGPTGVKAIDSWDDLGSFSPKTEYTGRLEAWQGD